VKASEQRAVISVSSLCSPEGTSYHHVIYRPCRVGEEGTGGRQRRWLKEVRHEGNTETVGIIMCLSPAAAASQSFLFITKRSRSQAEREPS